MSDIIADTETLEGHFDAPLETAVAVMRESLDKYQRRFIELCPFVCIATADGDGQPAISPKGDAPGSGKRNTGLKKVSCPASARY